MPAKKRKRTKRECRRARKRKLFLRVLVGVILAGAAVLFLLSFYRKEEQERSAFGAEAEEEALSPVGEKGGFPGAAVERVPAGKGETGGRTGEADGRTGTGGDTDAAKDGEPEATAPDAFRYAQLLADPEYMEANRIYYKEAQNPEETVLTFAGDILFAESYAPIGRIRARKNGILDSFTPQTLELMKGADIFMVNNEFPYSAGGSPLPEKQYTFRARPESADMLYDMDVDLVSLANNHAYDYGERAFLDTIDTLEEIGMPYVGGGRNLTEAARPVYFIVNDQKIAYLSATQVERLDNPDTKGAAENTPGTFRCWSSAELERLVETIGKVKENCDFLVLYIHWGTENTDQPDWAQLKQAPLLAEAGADLIIGDHPHCLQGITYEGDTPVFYSLGNFLFNSKNLDTCLVQAVLDENGLARLRFIPAHQQDCSVSLWDGAEKERVLSYMRTLSPGVSIDEDGYVTKAGG